QQAAPLWPLVQRDRAGDAIIDVLARDRDLVQVAVAVEEVELRLDGLALRLVLGADAGVEGDAGVGGSLRLHITSSVRGVSRGRVLVAPRPLCYACCESWRCSSANANSSMCGDFRLPDSQ